MIAGIFQNISLRRKDIGQSLRLFNTHLPGDPNGPARFEFTNYLTQNLDPKEITIAMGDMNFNEIEMQEALKKSAKESPFSLFSPYCTNVSPYVFRSKAIDHFIVKSESLVKINAPNEILQGLDSMVLLLQ
jgi:hypothetical protein